MGTLKSAIAVKCNKANGVNAKGRTISRAEARRLKSKELSSLPDAITEKIPTQNDHFNRRKEFIKHLETLVSSYTTLLGNAQSFRLFTEIKKRHSIGYQKALSSLFELQRLNRLKNIASVNRISFLSI